MLGFLVRRILFLIPVLLGGSAIVFSLIQMAPGDPIDVLLGVYASPEARAALREQYGLNDPAYVQYFRWLWAVLQGDWGTSIQQRVPVLPLVIEKFWITMLLFGAIALNGLKVNLLPLPSVLSTSIWPPCISTSRFAMASPMPTGPPPLMMMSKRVIGRSRLVPCRCAWFPENHASPRARAGGPDRICHSRLSRPRRKA